MSLVKKILSGWGKASRKPAEQAVTVVLELTGGAYGSEDEVEEIRLLGDDCDDAVRRAGVGEFEGEEFGDGRCALCFSGPSAERLWAAVAPVVRASRLSRGGQVVQRLGGPGAREVRGSVE